MRRSCRSACGAAPATWRCLSHWCRCCVCTATPSQPSSPWRCVALPLHQTCRCRPLLTTAALYRVLRCVALRFVSALAADSVHDTSDSTGLAGARRRRRLLQRPPAEEHVSVGARKGADAQPHHRHRRGRHAGTVWPHSQAVLLPPHQLLTLTCVVGTMTYCRAFVEAFFGVCAVCRLRTAGGYTLWQTGRKQRKTRLPVKRNCSVRLNVRQFDKH